MTQTLSYPIAERVGWNCYAACWRLHSLRVRTLPTLHTLLDLRGQPIKGFGGTASGPEDLVWGMEEINNYLK